MVLVLKHFIDGRRALLDDRKSVRLNVRTERQK